MPETVVAKPTSLTLVLDAFDLDQRAPALAGGADTTSLVRPVFKHTCIHELESFWPVLLWIALKSVGPGQHIIIDPDSSSTHIIATFFDASADYQTLGDMKLDLFRGGLARFDQDITPAITTYCSLLGPLLRNLLKVGRANG